MTDIKDGAPASLHRNCPMCNGNDVRWCGISVRPYCADCKHWGRVNFGDPHDAVVAWNASVRRADAIADAMLRASEQGEG